MRSDARLLFFCADSEPACLPPLHLPYESQLARVSHQEFPTDNIVSPRVWVWQVRMNMHSGACCCTVFWRESPRCPQPLIPAANPSRCPRASAGWWPAQNLFCLACPHVHFVCVYLAGNGCPNTHAGACMKGRPTLTAFPWFSVSTRNLDIRC